MQVKYHTYYFNISIATILCLFAANLSCQNNSLLLTLDDVIQISQAKSIDAKIAEQVFQQSFWEFKTFKAEKLPMVNLDLGLIDYNRSTTNREYDYITNDYRYFTTNVNTSSSRLSLYQYIPLTGGLVSAGFDVIRHDNFEKGTYDYSSNPAIQLIQPLNAYNKFKWNNRIEPQKYEIAKARYNQDLEEISIKAVNLFFDLAKAQVSKELSIKNMRNADTLYKISQGRYQMGKISENDLLQMELSHLNASASVKSAEIELYQAQIKLMSFLRIEAGKEVHLIIPDSVPALEIEIPFALQQAKENNPDILLIDNMLLLAKQQVAQKKAEKGLNANLVMAWGYSRIDSLFPDIITNENNMADYQNIQIGIRIPIVDWGVKNGHYTIARLNEEVVQLQADQAYTDFEQNVTLQIMNFNQQKYLFSIAKKSEIVADKRFEVSKHQFLIGKIDVLDLNVSQKDYDTEKANYINALREYWNAFYGIRKTTLYNFTEKQKIDHFINKD